jgi:hypothetical protein
MSAGLELLFGWNVGTGFRNAGTGFEPVVAVDGGDKPLTDSLSPCCL